MVFRATIGRDTPCEAGCCGAGTCANFCKPNWPPAGVSFALSGVTSVIGSVYGCGCCACCFDQTGITSCYNRLYELKLIGSGPAFETVNGARREYCGWVYHNKCTSPSTVLSCDVGQITTYVDAFFTIAYFPPNLNHNTGNFEEPFILLRVTVSGNTMAPGFFNTCEYNWDSYGSLNSNGDPDTFDPADFDCAGPWTLTGVGAWCNNSGSHDGAPTVTVSPIGDVPEETTGCCDPEPVHCTECTGLGPPANPCVPAPCGDSGTNGGISGGDVTGLSLCCDRGESVAATLNVAITNGAFCGCLESTFGVSWNEGKKAWIGAVPACNQFVTVVVYCLGGTFCLRVYCNDVLIASPCGDFATDTGNCSPLSITWTISTPVSPCCAIPSGYLVHVFE